MLCRSFIYMRGFNVTNTANSVTRECFYAAAR